MRGGVSKARTAMLTFNQVAVFLTTLGATNGSVSGNQREVGRNSSHPQVLQYLQQLQYGRIS